MRIQKLTLSITAVNHINIWQPYYLQSFTGYTFGHFETTGGFTELSMLGANSSTADDNYAGIYINNYPGLLPISTGVYEDSSTDFTV